MNTLTTDEVRDEFADSYVPDGETDGFEAEEAYQYGAGLFDAWLAEHDRVVKALALRDAADVIQVEADKADLADDEWKRGWIMSNYLYRVEYLYTYAHDGWMGADEKTFDTEGQAEAHMNNLTGYAYDPNYRIVRCPISAWEEVPN